jgi:V/A-type H+/Na+-transporting ATPase subunit D
MDTEPANPTRMELISVRERTGLARKGYQLLKQKRDVLVLELMSVLERSVALRRQLDARAIGSYAALCAAQTHHGVFEMENIAMSVRRTQQIKVSVRNAMGLKLPLISRQPEHRRLPERGYSIPYTTARVDEAAESFERALETVLELADKEASMKKILIEIEKTKRRVNALDSIVIPWLEQAETDISLKLEEMERDDIIALKSVKRKMEQAPQAQGNGST